MADSQEEKIAFAVRKAGYKVDDVIKLLDISRQTWYNRIRKMPLDPLFQAELESHGVIIDKESINVNNNLSGIELLRKENEGLRREIELLKEIIAMYKAKK
jgi:hypothetical protein